MDLLLVIETLLNMLGKLKEVAVRQKAEKLIAKRCVVMDLNDFAQIFSP